jgi:MoaA/NifB/PqqE/SkfB family radical SAM enzyme
MKLTGIHMLLTYQCNLECDHCFVWGGQWQVGTMTLPQLRNVFQQVKELGTVGMIYFEGGEPSLYYATMLKGIQEAKAMGFNVGIVSNGYWATSEEDALAYLEPLRGLIQDLSISSDMYHWFEELGENIKNIEKVAEELEIPIGVISIAQPEDVNAAGVVGTLPPGESGIMYRGRAAANLVSKAEKHSWAQFTECPFEDLVEPGRIHLDPLGHLHICQGISIGNLFETPLSEITSRYDPEAHPIVGPLLEEGPVGLVKRYDLPHEEAYADACHLCYEMRLALRDQFPDVLTPDQMYGVVGE